MIQIFLFCNGLSLSPKKYFGSKVPQINSINSTLITNDNTATATMNTRFSKCVPHCGAHYNHRIPQDNGGGGQF